MESDYEFFTFQQECHKNLHRKENEGYTTGTCAWSRFGEGFLRVSTGFQVTFLQFSPSVQEHLHEMTSYFSLPFACSQEQLLNNSQICQPQGRVSHPDHKRYTQFVLSSTLLRRERSDHRPIWVRLLCVCVARVASPLASDAPWPARLGHLGHSRSASDSAVERHLMKTIVFDRFLEIQIPSTWTALDRCFRNDQQMPRNDL